MKKVFSISISVLMIVTMLNITVAMHYCGGKEVASTVSISGKLASCGMHCSEKELPLSGTYFTNQCCDDIVTLFVIDSNYTPSFPFVTKTFQNSLHVIATPVTSIVNSYKDLISLYTNVSPPGTLLSTDVDLSDICVFRI